jgi:hypothetical protein
MPVGAFLFVPDNGEEPIYAIVRKSNLYRVTFFRMDGSPARGCGYGSIEIPYAEASKYGRFIPLVALFTGHNLGRTVGWMRHIRPKTSAVAADAADAAGGKVEKNGDRARSVNRRAVTGVPVDLGLAG